MARCPTITTFNSIVDLEKMKNYIHRCCNLLLLAVLFSCNGQQKSETNKNNTTQPLQTEADTPEVDAYFSESQTFESSYGPKSITRNILEDKNGTIWLATWEGIIRYDGNTFTNMTNKKGLRRFRVFSLLEDTMGNIWFGTIGAGLYRYDGKSFTNFTTEDGLVNDKIGAIMEDSNGMIWIGTMNGLSKYDGTTFTNFTIAGGANNNDINTIVEDNAGKLWLGTRGEAFIYDGIMFTKVITSQEQSFTNVRTIIKDKEGTMWLGGNDGFWSYHESVFRNHAINFTGYIYQDSKEHIWTSAASDGNSRNWVLTKYDKRSRATPFEIKSEENMFFGITEDSKGGMWLGTLRGVYRYDGTNFKDFAQPTIPFK